MPSRQDWSDTNGDAIAPLCLADQYNPKSMLIEVLVPWFKWFSSLLLLVSGTSALLTKSYREDASGRRQLTALGWVQVTGFVVGFALFAVTERQSAMSRVKDTAEKEALKTEVVSAKENAREAVERLKILRLAQADLLRQAETQAKTAQAQLDVANSTKEIQRELATNESELATRQREFGQMQDRFQATQGNVLNVEKEIQTSEGDIGGVQKDIRYAQREIADQQYKQIGELNTRLAAASSQVAVLEKSTRRLHGIEIEFALDAHARQTLLSVVPRKIPQATRDCLESSFSGMGRWPQAVLSIKTADAGYSLVCDATSQIHLSVLDEETFHWRLLWGKEHVRGASDSALRILRALFGNGLQLVMANGEQLGRLGRGSGTVSATVRGGRVIAIAGPQDVTLTNLERESFFVCLQNTGVDTNVLFNVALFGESSFTVGPSTITVRSVDPSIEFGRTFNLKWKRPKPGDLELLHLHEDGASSVISSFLISGPHDLGEVRVKQTLH